MADGESAFEAANQVADTDIARGARKAIASPRADFAFQESAAAKGQQDRFEELVGEVFLFSKIPRLDVFARPEPGQLDDGA